ncbi:MAG: alanine--tRNA ligase-related protein, partial [Nanoarchaeota archaeon]
EFHHTFFEMLGNWSLGDYWKKEAIQYSFDFLTKVLKIPLKDFSVTCFKGDKNAPKDTVSESIWLSLGVKKIKFLDKEDNWWGPAGLTGPCGPDTEMFWNGVEIWNNVFMEYNKTKDSRFIALEQRNVDTGMGVERTLTLLNNLNDDYLSQIFLPIIKEIEKISNKKYNSNKETTKAMRIIADHLRASVFILGDPRAIKPSNIGQGYVLRRLIRRAIRYGKILGIKNNFTSQIAKSIIPLYHDYQELAMNHKFIISQLDEEELKFKETLEKGLKKFQEIIETHKHKGIITGRDAFLLFQSYGFPIEITEELADEQNLKVDLDEYNDEFKRHQDLSRTNSGIKFKSGLADDSENVRRL